MGRERERPKITVDAGSRLSEHSSGDRQSISIPSGVSLWNPKKAGVYVIDVIPYQLTDTAKRFLKNYGYGPGDWHYERTFYTHAKIGVNGDSYSCPAKNFGRPCPVCEFRTLKGASTSKEDKQLVYDLKPKERQMYLIVDQSEPQKGVQLWEIAHWCFGKQLESKMDNASEKKKAIYKRFADPEDGSTLRVVATNTPMGEGGGTYLLFSVDEFQERDKPLNVDLFYHGIDLSKCVREPSYDELNKVFLQLDEAKKEGAGPRSRDADDDAPPARGRARGGDDDEPPARTRNEPPARETTPPVREDREWKEGDVAEFEYKDEMYTGTITEVNHRKEIAQVQVKGEGRPRAVDLDDLRTPQAGPGRKGRDADEEPSARGRARGRDDDEDAPPARGRARAAEPEPEPKRTRTIRDDDEPARPARRPAPADDDEPPARGRAKPAAEDPPARTRAKPNDGWDDDEDRPLAPRGGRAAAADDEPPARGRAKPAPAAADDEDEPPARTRAKR